MQDFNLRRNHRYYWLSGDAKQSLSFRFWTLNFVEIDIVTDHRISQMSS